MTLDTDKLADQAMRLLEEGRPRDARSLYLDICRISPADPDVWLMAGAISGDLGLTDEARQHLQRALELDPAFADAHLALASLLHRELQHPQALLKCDDALKADEEFAEAWLLKSVVLGAMGRYPEAVNCAHKAGTLWPECAEAYVNMGHGLDAMGQREAAIEQYRHALSLNPQLHAAYTGMTEALVNLGRVEEADACCTQAIKLAPEEPSGLRARARVLQQQGKNEDAFRILEPMIDTGTLDASAAVTFARACARLERSATAASVIETMLEKTENNTIDTRWKLHMALGRVYDDMQDYDRAFDHFQRGHQLKTGGFDPNNHRASIDSIISCTTRERLAPLPRAQLISDTPIFIVGMPRSGTTLVEQILSSHPDVFGAGELTRIGDIAQRLPVAPGGQSDYPLCIAGLKQPVVDEAAREYLDYLQVLSQGDTRRVTDKLPGNFMHLGLIDLLFPGARIIHCMRDPLDTCLSCYSQNFNGHEYTHDLAHLGIFYREYQRLMEHWRTVLRIPMLEVQYETLIEHTEQGSRQLIEFCGLPWDERCLRFYENKRTVITASYDQVCRPIYKTSSERWRNYERYIDPLRIVLSEPELK